jgi:hypothetical protein
MPPVQIQIRNLTRQYSGIANVIISPIEIHNTITGTSEKTHGIWDTGATGSAITISLAQKLGLTKIGSAKVKGVHGIKYKNVYGVKLVLNSQVEFILPVTECDGLTDDGSAEFLIGMDVISKGDFAISNFQGQTTMSFRVPSIQRIDFVHQNPNDNIDAKNLSRGERRALERAKKKKR